MPGDVQSCVDYECAFMCGITFIPVILMFSTVAFRYYIFVLVLKLE